MKVQIITRLKRELNKKTNEWETKEKRINNVEEIEIDPLNDKYAISSDKQLRYLFLNKEWYRLSLKSYKECRKKNLVGVLASLNS